MLDISKLDYEVRNGVILNHLFFHSEMFKNLDRPSVLQYRVCGGFQTPGGTEDFDIKVYNSVEELTYKVKFIAS